MAGLHVASGGLGGARKISGSGAAPVPSGQQPARILVKQVNWLGDLVMSLPALRAVRRAWPDAHLSVLVKRELASFFDGAHAVVDEVMAYSVGRGLRAAAGQIRIVRAIRSRGFDLAVLFPNSFRAALWARLGGVPRRAGFATDMRGLLLTHKAAPSADAVGGHQVGYWLTMLRDTLGLSGDPSECGLWVHQGHRRRMSQWLAANRRLPQHPLIAIAPAAAYGPAKEWPAKRYSALVDLLGARNGAECVLVGSPQERRKCEEVAAAASTGALVAAGQTTIGELIALLSLCDGFAGNDSGCMHLASAVGLATVGIFGSTNPARTGPLGSRSSVVYEPPQCSPCLDRTCGLGHYNCFEPIAPEHVAQALEKMGAVE